MKYMGIRFYKPNTPGTRNRSVSDFMELCTGRRGKIYGRKQASHGKNPSGFCPKRGREDSLTVFLGSTGGRNNRGVITCRHRGGGHKRLYRIIDFRRDKMGTPAVVTSIQYDPYRNARLALVRYVDGEKRYILHPQGLKVGDSIISDLHAPITVGNALPLRNIPLGTCVHNVEFTRGSGGQIARSAGALAQILAKEGDFVTIRIPSKEIRLVSKHCWATIGQVGNVDAYNISIGKAGRNRWLGNRPTVRGSAMNPVDHPHGGGEGRSPIGRSHPCTPWGRPALGVKTRQANKFSNQFIIRKRK